MKMYDVVDESGGVLRESNLAKGFFE